MGLRVLIYQESEFWIAHCLELNLVTQGEGVDETLEKLSRMIEIQLDALDEVGLGRFEPRTRAPPECFTEFAVGEECTDQYTFSVRSHVVDSVAIRRADEPPTARR